MKYQGNFDGEDEDMWNVDETDNEIPNKNKLNSTYQLKNPLATNKGKVRRSNTVVYDYGLLNFEHNKKPFLKTLKSDLENIQKLLSLDKDSVSSVSQDGACHKHIIAESGVVQEIKQIIDTRNKN